MTKYIAILKVKARMNAAKPPPIEEINPKTHNIYMVELIDKVDGSAEGIGQVLELVQCQTGLTPEELFGCFQSMEGDPSTCQNFNILRSLWVPSKHT